MRNLQSLRLLLADKDKEIERAKNACSEWLNKYDESENEKQQLEQELSKEKQAYINMYNMYDEEKKKNKKAIEYVEMTKVIEEGNTLQQITNYERNILKILKGGEK